MDKDFENMPLSSLCSRQDGQIVVSCFKIARPLSDIASSFHVVTQKHPNNVFHRYWAAQKTLALGKVSCVADIVPQLWQPSFQKCLEFLESVRSMTISLGEVDQLLVNREVKDVELDITRVDMAVCECLGRGLGGSMWIMDVVQRMEQYRLLCQHSRVATTFLQLRDTLGLTGDFRIIERLSSEVC